MCLWGHFWPFIGSCFTLKSVWAENLQLLRSFFFCLYFDLNFFFNILIIWQVFGPGGAKEPIEVLSDFLGREPSIQAFVDSKSEYTL